MTVARLYSWWRSTVMATVEVEVPDELIRTLEAAGVAESDLGPRAARELAVELYADGRLSLGKAARLACMSRLSLWQLLVDRGHPVFRYTESDYESDRRSAAAFRVAEPRP